MSSRHWCWARTCSRREIAGAALQPIATDVVQDSRAALYLWEPRLPAMGRKAAPVNSALTQTVEQFVGRVAICRPPQPLLGIANRLAGIGPDDAIRVARLMPLGIQQVL